jgi:hypothetical protein
VSVLILIGVGICQGTGLSRANDDPLLRGFAEAAGEGWEWVKENSTPLTGAAVVVGLAAAQNYNRRFQAYARMTAQDFRTQVETRAQMVGVSDPPGTPRRTLTIILDSPGDPNLAFKENVYYRDAYRGTGFRMREFESVESLLRAKAGTGNEAVLVRVRSQAELRALMERGGDFARFDQIDISGHGRPGGLMVGGEEIRADWWKPFRGRSNIAKTGGQVRIFSCNTGARPRSLIRMFSGDSGQEFVKSVAGSLVPNGGDVVASTRYLHFGPELDRTASGFKRIEVWANQHLGPWNLMRTIEQAPSETPIAHAKVNPNVLENGPLDPKVCIPRNLRVLFRRY